MASLSPHRSMCDYILNLAATIKDPLIYFASAMAFIGTLLYILKRSNKRRLKALNKIQNVD